MTHQLKLSSVCTVFTPVDGPKDSQKFDIYIIEDGIYEFLFSSQQSPAKLVQQKYKMLFGNFKTDMKEVNKKLRTQPNSVLLKESHSKLVL